MRMGLTAFGRHRSLTTIVAVVLALAGYTYGPLIRPAAVAAVECAAFSGHAWFAGVDSVHVNAVRGSKVDIEYVNEELCSTAGGDDFSSFWTSVIGIDPNDDNGSNIYQIGVDKCRGDACVPGVPVNQSYYFWAYGRMQSTSCGVEVLPIPHDLGDAAAGTKTYKVLKEYTPGAGWFYNVYINTSLKWTVVAGDLEACWGGVDASETMNEVALTSTQSGGSIANKQTYSNAFWHNGTGWNAIIGPVQGGNCTAHQLATMQCKWRTGVPEKWDSWDTRWP